MTVYEISTFKDVRGTWNLKVYFVEEKDGKLKQLKEWAQNLSTKEAIDALAIKLFKELTHEGNTVGLHLPDTFGQEIDVGKMGVYFGESYWNCSVNGRFAKELPLVAPTRVDVPVEASIQMGAQQAAVMR